MANVELITRWSDGSVTRTDLPNVTQLSAEADIRPRAPRNDEDPGFAYHEFTGRTVVTLVAEEEKEQGNG